MTENGFIYNTQLEALELIYAELVSIDEGRRDTVRKALESQDSASTPPLALSVGDIPCLYISLPRRYPEKSGPDLRWKDGGGRSQSEKDEALARLAEISSNHAGYEHLMQIIQDFQMMEDERKEEAASSSFRAAAAATPIIATAAKRPVLKRVLIYFHHIINKTKREIVMKEAISLGLGGYSKIGWPGVVVCEGEEEDVLAYVKHLQSLRWQEIRIRGEERIECLEGQSINDLRAMHHGWEELREHDMSKLANAMREAGLEDLFRTLMK